MRAGHIVIAGLMFLGGISAGSVASASDIELSAGLSPGDENPPAEGGGNGFAEIHVNTETGEMKWYVEFHDLTSPAIAAHFHGPASTSENADVLMPIDPVSPSTGTVLLSPEGVQDLLAGHWYINVHTEKFPMGEIRGQVGGGFL